MGIPAVVAGTSPAKSPAGTSSHRLHPRRGLSTPTPEHRRAQEPAAISKPTPAVSRATFPETKTARVGHANISFRDFDDASPRPGHRPLPAPYLPLSADHEKARGPLRAYPTRSSSRSSADPHPRPRPTYPRPRPPPERILPRDSIRMFLHDSHVQAAFRAIMRGGSGPSDQFPMICTLMSCRCQYGAQRLDEELEEGIPSGATCPLVMIEFPRGDHANHSQGMTFFSIGQRPHQYTLASTAPTKRSPLFWRGPPRCYAVARRDPAGNRQHRVTLCEMAGDPLTLCCCGWADVFSMNGPAVPRSKR